MTVRRTHWRGVPARALLLVLGLALVPLPAIAGDTSPGPKATPNRTSLHAAVAREAAKMASASTVTRHAEQTSSTDRGPGFFRTKPGMVALAVMIAGTSYAIYSTQHDRVKSPAKQ